MSIFRLQPHNVSYSGYYNGLINGRRDYNSSTWAHPKTRRLPLNSDRNIIETDGCHPYRPQTISAHACTTAATEQIVSSKSNPATNSAASISANIFYLKKCKIRPYRPYRPNEIGPRSQVHFVYVADLIMYLSNSVLLHLLLNMFVA